MDRADARGKRPTKEVRKELLQLLESTADSDRLRKDLDHLSREMCFGGLTHVWGPALYHKAPILFRPFILKHFSSHILEKGWIYKPIPWKGDVAQRLQAWMDKVDEADDIELFTRLYTWRIIHKSLKTASAEWHQELLSRFRKAPDRKARQIVLAKLDLWFWLDEETAIALYHIESDLASAFILKHLPRAYSLFTGEKRTFWTNLAKIARKNEDNDFYFRLYREQIPIKTWSQEVLNLCKNEQNIDKLLDQLRERHPNTWTKDLGDTFCDLLQVRGKELFPYILPELRRVVRGWFRSGFERLISLAKEKDWLELWAGLLRTCAKPKEYNQAVIQVTSLGSKEAKKRLYLLAGIGQEWNFGNFGLATTTFLSDKAAVAVYQRYPEILRGALKAQVNPNWSNAYPDLLKLLLKQDDEHMLDYLASRLVTTDGGWGRNKLLKPAEDLANYYEQKQKDPKEFARRAARVLGQVPPYVLWNYDEIIRKNRLARLLYERSAEFYLADPLALQDLIEAPEIRAQLLAYKALSVDSDDARRLAQENVHLLLGTLLRPLHRKTRVVAFRALKNAATDLECAGKILDRAREACYLPDRRYPKDDLTGLIGSILHRWPALRTEDEQPIIYGAPSC
jgi:hypothetical protein